MEGPLISNLQTSASKPRCRAWAFSMPTTASASTSQIAAKDALRRSSPIGPSRGQGSFLLLQPAHPQAALRAFMDCLLDRRPT